MANKLEGFQCLVTTPLNQDRTINWNGARKVCDWLVENGCNGIWVGGIHSGCAFMDESQKKELLDAFFEANNGRMFCGGGFYGRNVDEAIRMAKHVEDLGYDVAWGSAPAGTRSEEAVLDFYKTLHDNTNIPLGIYHTGPGPYMRPVFIAKILQLERFICLKDTQVDFDHIFGLYIYGVYKRVKVFPVRAFLPYLMLGAAGVLNFEIYCKPGIRIWEAFKKGDLMQTLLLEEDWILDAGRAYQTVGTAAVPAPLQGDWTYAACQLLVGIDPPGPPPSRSRLVASEDDIKLIKKLIASGEDIPYPTSAGYLRLGRGPGVR